MDMRLKEDFLKGWDRYFGGGRVTHNLLVYR